MIPSGHAQTRIAYNQHRTAPALSAQAQRDPDVFEATRREARNAAKRARRAQRGAK